MFLQTSTQPTEEIKEEKADLHDLKKKRDEYTLEIRKKKREEILGQKRHKNFDLEHQLKDDTLESYNLVQDPQLRGYVTQWMKKTFTVNELSELAQAAYSPDILQQHYGVIGIRKLLFSGEHAIIQRVIDLKMISKFINNTQLDKEPHLQVEAVWALTSVASGTPQHLQSIIDKGGVQCFIKLLSSEISQIVEAALWALAKCMGTSIIFRDRVLQKAGLEAILKVLGTTTVRNHLKFGIYAIANLCKSKPFPPFKLIEIAIPTLCEVIKKENDPEILLESAWVLAYLSGEDSKIEYILDTGVTPRLVSLLEGSSMQMLVCCLMIIGNLITGTKEQAEILLQEPDLVPRLFMTAKHEKSLVRKEACWTLANITSFCVEFNELVVGNPNYLEILFNIANSDVSEVQREAVIALTNTTKNSNPEQITRMVYGGFMDCFVQLMQSKDNKVVEVVLEGLFNILNWGAIIAGERNTGENPFLVEFENKSGVVMLEELQNHPSQDVYERALRILEQHFETENVLGI